MALTCGAVTGAFMVIGLKYGRTSTEDKQAKEETYRRVREFTHKFVVRTGSVICKDLMGCDISTAEGLEYAKQQNIGNTLCPRFVRDSVEILEEIL
jgi:C_GCAxxG_C_C family probable redox protein